MRILVVMGGFFPGRKYGGPPVSVDNFCSLMSKMQCFIITHNHDKDENTSYEGIESGKWIRRKNCSVMYLPDERYNKNTFEKAMRDIKPDLVYLQGLFQSCVIPCLYLARKYNIKVLLAPRGELCPGAFKKKYKKIPYIYYLRLTKLFKNVSFQSTSEEETEAIKKYLKVNNSRIYYLTNIPSIPQKACLRDSKKIGEGRFVFLSRIHPKKNLISAIHFFANVQGTIIFDIYGPLEDEEYWEECKKEIKKLPPNINVNYCGMVPHDEVHEVFSKYDAFVFPTLSENYGHVIAESLIVGTSVIISDQTPWNDINVARAGWAIPLNDENAFSEAIQKVVDSDCVDLRHNVERYIQNKLKLSELYNQYNSAIKIITGK